MTSHSGTVEDERLVKCDRCDGFGYRFSEDSAGTNVHDCARCNGTGKVAAPSRPVEAGELVPVAWVAAVYLGQIMDGEDLVDAALWRQPDTDGSRVPLYDHATVEALQARVEELERERDELRTKLTDAKDEVVNLSAIVATGVDDVAGAKIDDLEASAEALSTRLQEAEKALEPFSNLELPKTQHGNAGFYSLRFKDIEAAKATSIRSRTPGG